MKHLIKLPAIFAILLAAAACSKNAGAILSRVYTIATAKDGKLITDEGDTYIINDGADGKDLSSGRFYVGCDIIKDRGGNTYDVNLLTALSVLVKDIKHDGTPLDPEVLVNDPIEPENIWISGGYVNMELLLFVLKDSETRHLVNLVLDTGRSNADSLFFDVRHNAYGEFPDSPAYEGNEGFYIGVFYASFALDGLPAPMTKKTTVIFRYTWYDDYEKFTRKNYSITGTYKP